MFPWVAAIELNKVKFSNPISRKKRILIEKSLEAYEVR
jgi:hypothetical protein